MDNTNITESNNSTKRGFLHSKITKVVATLAAFTSLVIAGYGIYSLKKNDTNPRDGWSKELATATEQIKELPTFDRSFGKHSIAHAAHFDSIHNATGHSLNYNYNNRYLMSLNMYEDDHAAKYNSISVAWRASEEVFLREIEWLDNLKFRVSFNSVDGEIQTHFGVDVGILQNRMVISIDTQLEFIDDQITIPNIDVAMEWRDRIGEYSYSMYFENTVESKSVLCNIVSEAANLFYPMAKIMAGECLFALNTLIDFPYANAETFFADLNNITRIQSNNTRAGNISLFIALPIFFLALLLLLLPIVFSYHPKTKEVTVTNTESAGPIPTNNEQPIATQPSVINKINTTIASSNTIILRAIIIGFMALSVILTNIALSFYLKDDAFIVNTNTINIVSKNLLIIVSMSLAFFGCVYISKKDKGAIKPLLVASFLAGVFFYFFNILSYQYLIPNAGDSYLVTSSFLQTVPDNVFVPLFFALLAYYYLIKNIQDRSFSIIKNLIPLAAVAVLIASCFINPIANPMLKPYYLTAMFSPNLIIANMFIATYLIISYLVNYLTYKHHPDMNYDDYLSSSQHDKNSKIIAITITIALFIIDLICRFAAKDNILNFGYNHGIILLVPIILLYKSNSKQKDFNLNILMACLVAIILIDNISVLAQSASASINMLKEMK